MISIPSEGAMWMERKEAGLFYFFARPAQWSYWSQHDRVPLDFAVLLSLNVDPYPGGLLPSEDYLGMVCGALEEVKAPNRNRINQRRAIAHSHRGQQLAAVGDLNGLPAVRLSDFARWAIDVARWELPPELAKLAAVSDAPPGGETRLEKAARLAKAKFSTDLARGEPWPTDEDGAQWLVAQKLVTSRREALRVLGVIRPDDLKRGPRSAQDDAADE